MPEIPLMDLDGHSVILIIMQGIMIPGFIMVDGTRIFITWIIILITTGHTPG